MELGQRFRAKLLGPWLAQLTRIGVSPDMVTAIAGLTGAAFLPLWLTENWSLALTAIWLHVLLDGLDGPLARFQKIGSSRGSFTDTFTDQLVVTLAMVGWMVMAPQSLNISMGALYVFLYAQVVAMSMVRNALYVPYSWLVRPRFFVYGAMTFDHIASSQWTVTVLCLSNALLAIKSVSGFLALRKQIPGPNSTD
jgi:phosphatidylglycerophosphate synthase